MDFRAKIRQLWSQNTAPHPVATGSAIGMFFGFLPFFGLKTLLSYFVSLLVRANTTAAIVGVTLHDLLLPFLPVILRVEYQIGFWLLSNPHHFAAKMQFKNIKANPFRGWHDLQRIGGPILLGSLVLGIVAGLLTYGVAYLIFLQRQKRLARQKKEDQTLPLFHDAET